MRTKPRGLNSVRSRSSFSARPRARSTRTPSRMAPRRARSWAPTSGLSAPLHPRSVSIDSGGDASAINLPSNPLSTQVSISEDQSKHCFRFVLSFCIEKYLFSELKRPALEIGNELRVVDHLPERRTAYCREKPASDQGASRAASQTPERSG